MTNNHSLSKQLRRVATLTDQLDFVEPAGTVLANLRELRDQVNRAIDHGIIHAKESGLYWDEIGTALRASPTAVAQRHQAIETARRTQLPRNR
jgi:hypothetical protein